MKSENNPHKNIDSSDVKHKMKFIDLFAGSGGFALALENCRDSKVQWECTFANDIDRYASIIYQQNFPHTNFRHADLCDIPVEDVPVHDLLCGGFPCQPFSIAGKQKGFNDSRSNVFWSIIKILKVRMPKVFLLENVKNLLSHDGGGTFNIIKEQLEDIGYYVTYKVLDTAKITKIPHHRERIYIVGFLEKRLYESFSFENIKDETDRMNLSEIIHHNNKNIPKLWITIEGV